MEAKVVNIEDLQNRGIEEQQTSFQVKQVNNPQEPVEPVEPQEPAEPVEPVEEPVEPQEPVEEPIEPVLEEEPIKPIELNDDSVLEYIKGKYNKELDNIDSLFEEKEAPQLPENIQKLLDFQKETGRGIEDFVALNKDWGAVSDENKIREYLKYKKPHLDPDEIEFEIKRRFSFDEDIHTDEEIYGKKIAKKDFIYEASKFFNEMKDSYAAPLESSVQTEIPTEYKEALDLVNKYKQELKAKEDEGIKKSQDFLNKTKELLNDNFEGFKFAIDEDKNQVFKPSDVKEMIEQQSNVTNFLNKFLDENGSVKDLEGYHKALAVAMNPDSFAKFFYEQGKSDAIEEEVINSKNIDMNVRKTHEERINDSGMKIRAISSLGDSELKLQIRK